MQNSPSGLSSPSSPSGLGIQAVDMKALDGRPKIKIQSFEDILAWQKAEQLGLQIYTIFRDCRDYAFRDQVQRAAISITNNIAEGYERRGDKELSRFLYIAKGSCGEVRSMLHLAPKLGYITESQYKEASDLSLSVTRLLSAFIKSLA